MFAPEEHRNSKRLSISSANISLPITPERLYHVFEHQIRTQHPQWWPTIKTTHGYSFKYPIDGELQYVDNINDRTTILPQPPQSRDGVIYVLTNEVAQGKINGSMNIDYFSPTFVATATKKLDKTKPVLVYCAAGGRSASAAKDLKKAGFKKVYDLEGGYDAWKE
jgi:rhodanese-related sulfurtransferase